MKQLFILFAFGLGCLDLSAQQVKAARDFDTNGTSSGDDPYANSNAIKSQYNDCESRLNNLRHVIDSLNNNYNVDSKQYEQGLFCSDCHRSKRQIEAAGLNFYEHIQAGAATGRHIVPATRQQMADLYNDYMNQYNSAKKDFDNNRASCDALNNQYNSARNQDYQALQNEQMKEQQAKIDAENEKRKEAQDKLRQQQEERQREAQARIDQIVQQQKEQQQREQQAQNELDAKTKELGDETQNKLDNARQQNQLQDYTDPTDQAKSILNSPGSGVSSVFAPAFANTTDNSLLSVDQQVMVMKMQDMVSDYWQNLKSTVSSDVSGLFNNSVPAVDDIDAPPAQGWSGSNTNFLQSAAQKIQTAFSDLKTQYNQVMEPFNNAKDMNDQAKPKSAFDFFNDLGNNDQNVMGQISDGSINDQQFDNDAAIYQANNAGGLRGQAQGITSSPWHNLAGLIRFTFSKSKQSNNQNADQNNGNSQNNDNN